MQGIRNNIISIHFITLALCRKSKSMLKEFCLSYASQSCFKLGSILEYLTLTLKNYCLKKDNKAFFYVTAQHEPAVKRNARGKHHIFEEGQQPMCFAN